MSLRFVRDNLAVCGFDGIGNHLEFARHRFRAQLQCTEHFDDWLPNYVEVKCTPFPDGFPIPRAVFQEAQGWLDDHWEAGSRILISCAAGQSRSVTIAVALLSRQAQVPFTEAAMEVFARVPGAYPHPLVFASAAAYSGQPVDFNTLRGLYAAIAEQPGYPWSIELLQQATGQTYG